MKKEYIYGIIWGFLGFFITGLLGVNNIFIQVGIIIIGIILMHFLLFSDQKK